MAVGVFAQNVIHFARYLRAKGLEVDPRTGMELLTSAHVLGLVDVRDIRCGFRSLVVTRPDQLPVFEEAFDLFFGSGGRKRYAVEAESDRTAQSYLPVLASAGRLDEKDLEDSSEQLGASHAERLGTRDFGELTPDEMAEVRRLISRMVWRPAEALSRRWMPDSLGRRPDMRRTLRNAVGPRGELLEMEFRSRKPRRRPLVIIADVSGSMEKYVELLLYFAHSAPARMGRVETFVFSTRLTRITHELRRRDPAMALRLVAGRVHDWSGGTRIGEALGTYNRLWSRRVARGGPIGMIISDGWDRGDPDLLSEEMARFSRSVHRTIWLNPLAGRKGYAPETRGLKAALPYVDDFLPAARLVDLGGVIRLLESMPPHPSQAARRSSTRGARAS
ncbi:MAG: VWA domain-containing protein [Acidimicrobiia bacterium]|nr:VWA domain-containing protein [bacterium]MYB45165.1 VWA domain-containing protein [Acidimicrobiia bacterium]MYC85050.1 VWA domain-containing protein [Acidimicrobiia bacterium]